MNYPNAERCYDCPRCSGADGCPWWWEIVGHDLQKNAPSIDKGCGKAMLPHLIAYAMSAANLATRSANEARNILVEAIDAAKQPRLNDHSQD